MPLVSDQYAQLAEFLSVHRRVLALTGAGCSTESGIPDYRDVNGDWKHPQPVTYQQFAGSASVRQRYWARSAVGWTRILGAAPNRAHRALAALETEGYVSAVLTQNVDGLHTRAGSRRVIDLHGRLDAVRCLGCGAVMPRADFQSRLIDLNPSLARATADALAPDGDAAVTIDYASIDVPPCPACGGIVKPDVVFFGEGVPPSRVSDAFAELDAASGLLIVGSSLMVFSGYRFAQGAARAGKAIAAINIGVTRADELVTLKIEASCGDALADVQTRLLATRTEGAAAAASDDRRITNGDWR